MNAHPEGRIEIVLTRRQDAPPEVALHSSRRQLAQRLLAGQTPERAAQLVGLVFSLCGRAQRAAVELAAEAAGMPARLDGRARAGRVLAELGREHAWRLLADWPKQQGEAGQMAALRRLLQAGEESEVQAAGFAGVLAESVLGEPAAAWLDRTSGPDGLMEFEAWRRAGTTDPARLFARLGGRDPCPGALPLLPGLSELAPKAILAIADQALADPAFCRAPRLAGGCAETGALGRCRAEPLIQAWVAAYGSGVGARMLARLLELARLPARLAGDGSGAAAAWSPAPGVGVAAVETSRGLLIHALTLAGGRIDQYRIVAPTEWNFQPGGPLEAALRALPEADWNEAGVRRVALAMDPCVEFEVAVTGP